MTEDPLAALAPWERDGALLGRTWPMLSVKQALAGLDREEALSRFMAAIGRSAEGARLERLPLRSMLARARAGAASQFLQMASGGTPFENRPPHVVGEGDQRLISHVERSLWLAAFDDVGVRGRSQVIEGRGEVLLDFEGGELARIDDELRLDSAIFAREADQVLVISEPALPALEVDEAFSLLGPNTYAFGHWLVEYLPRLWLALDSGHLPPLTVLIDQGMMPQHRELLELLVPPGTTVLEVASMQRVRVRRLWTAPTFYYAPMYPQFTGDFRYDWVAASPRHFSRLFAGMWAKLAPVAESPASGRRLYLARKPHHHRKLVNHEEIEAVAQAQGFERVYMEEHGIVEQLRMLRGASHLLGPEGSAFFLAFFARPGTKVGFLNHPHVEFLTEVTALIDATGAECTVFTGSYERIEEGGYVHFSDYRIDAAALSRALAAWAPSP